MTAVEKVKRVLFVVVSIWAIASVLYQGYAVNRSWFSDPHVEQTAREFAVDDVDDAVFLKDIGHHHSIGGPLFWWHNGWHGTAYPYYWRPMTMFGFWTEYQLFGAYRFDRWQIADSFFHLLFAAVLWLFAYRVTGSRFAGPLAVVVMTGFQLFDVPMLDFADVFTTPGADVVLGNWKDQPEQWAAICTLASLLSVMGLRPGKDEREKLPASAWWSAIGFAAASVCFKESGWLTFPMLLVALVYVGRLRQIPKWAWFAMIAVWAVLIALRASSGHHVMFPPPDPSNHNGLSRYLKHVLDPDIQQATTDSWPVIVFAAFTGLLILARRPRFLPKFGILLAAAALTSVLLGVSHHSDPAAGMALLVDPRGGLVLFVTALVEALILIVAYRFRPVRSQAVFLYLLILLSDLPDIAVRQPNEHMQYFTNGLQSVMVIAIALACARQVAVDIVDRRRKRLAAV